MVLPKWEEGRATTGTNPDPGPRAPGQNNQGRVGSQNSCSFVLRSHTDKGHERIAYMQRAQVTAVPCIKSSTAKTRKFIQNAINQVPS